MANADEPCRANIIDRLPPDLLADIHGRLGFVDRIALAAASSAQSRRSLKPEAPCLVVPGATEERVTVFSLADRHAASARAADPAMCDHAVLGSSGGWLVTADERGSLRMANPVTGQQAELPAITTIPFLHALSSGGWFCLALEPFARVRFRGSVAAAGDDGRTYDGQWWGGTYTHTAGDMRLCFYRKVVLGGGAGESPGPRSYAAMLLLTRRFGAPAFATGDDPAWRLAPSRDGVEDAVHHGGRFYSVSYSGAVDAWERDRSTGEFTSRPAAPNLPLEEDDGGDSQLLRKYLAAAPDGRLMAVLKYSTRNVTGASFKVLVLDEARGRWEQTADIGDAALFVGVSGSLCVSAREHGQEVTAGCVYFTDDDIGQVWQRSGNGSRNMLYRSSNGHQEVPDVGVYSLREGKVRSIVGLAEHPQWPPPAWFIPSV